MMKIILDSKELGRIELKVRRFPVALLRECKEAIVDTANKIRRTIIEGMYNTPKTGTKYREGGKWHTSSSPGNYPAVRTSELVSRIVPPDIRENEVEVGAEAGAPYDITLESGTEKMEARPWLQPSL